MDAICSFMVHFDLQAPEMLSKPTFEVDLIKPGGKTLSFTCSFVQEEEHPEGQDTEEEGELTKCAPGYRDSILASSFRYICNRRGDDVRG